MAPRASSGSTRAGRSSAAARTATAARCCRRCSAARCTVAPRWALGWALRCWGAQRAESVHTACILAAGGLADWRSLPQKRCAGVTWRARRPDVALLSRRRQVTAAKRPANSRTRLSLPSPLEGCVLPLRKTKREGGRERGERIAQAEGRRGGDKGRRRGVRRENWATHSSCSNADRWGVGTVDRSVQPRAAGGANGAKASQLQRSASTPALTPSARLPAAPTSAAARARWRRAAAARGAAPARAAARARCPAHRWPPPGRRCLQRPGAGGRRRGQAHGEGTRHHAGSA